MRFIVGKRIRNGRPKPPEWRGMNPAGDDSQTTRSAGDTMLVFMPRERPELR
ncbi:hypothetical protein AB7M18_004662 [Pseudomonas viridiflava]